MFAIQSKTRQISLCNLPVSAQKRLSAPSGQQWLSTNVQQTDQRLLNGQHPAGMQGSCRPNGWHVRQTGQDIIASIHPLTSRIKSIRFIMRIHAFASTFVHLHTILNGSVHGTSIAASYTIFMDANAD